jgi:hypothetical protein
MKHVVDLNYKAEMVEEKKNYRLWIQKSLYTENDNISYLITQTRPAPLNKSWFVIYTFLR